MLPNLALYIKSFGATNQEVGWVMAAFAAGLLGFRPKMSRLTDTQGRKPSLLIGVVVIALAPILYLDVMLLPQTTVTIPILGWQCKSAVLALAIVRAFHGLSVAAFATAYTAAVADMAPPKHRGELISFMSLAGPMGMAMGPALGGYLKSSFALAFLSMTVMGTVGTILVLMSKEPPQASIQLSASGKQQHADDIEVAPRTRLNQLSARALSLTAKADTAKADFTEVMGAESIATESVATGSVATESIATTKPTTQKQPFFWSLIFAAPIRIPALMLFMVGIAFGATITFVPLYVEQMAWDINVGLIFTASAIASFSIRTFSGTASDQLGRGRFISLGLIFYTLSMVTLYFAQSPTMLLLAGALQGAGSGTTIPIIAALMTDRSQPNERGLTFGLCLTGFDLGIALAGPIMGQIADISGSYTFVFALAGLMTFLGLLTFITTSSKDLNHSVRFALHGGRDVYAVNS